MRPTWRAAETVSDTIESLEGAAGHVSDALDNWTPLLQKLKIFVEISNDISQVCHTLHSILRCTNSGRIDPSICKDRVQCHKCRPEGKYFLLRIYVTSSHSTTDYH